MSTNAEVQWVNDTEFFTLGDDVFKSYQRAVVVIDTGINEGAEFIICQNRDESIFLLYPQDGSKWDAEIKDGIVEFTQPEGSTADLNVPMRDKSSPAIATIRLWSELHG